MAKDRSLEGTPEDGGEHAARTQVKIKWDDSNMRNVYANVVNATGTREEIVLLFGMNQAWHSEQKELTVQLSDRIGAEPVCGEADGAFVEQRDPEL